MPDNIYKKMFYSFKEPAWHNIRKPSEVERTAEEVMNEEFDGGFEVALRPVTVVLNGEPKETGDFAIVRSASKSDPQEHVFDYCTARYHPLQPMEVARIYDTSVVEFVETMAFLGAGEDMFISWKMPEFEVVKGDGVKLYGIVRTGFDTMHGPRLFTSIYRPVCQNTINLAEDWAERNKDGEGKGSIWKGKGTNINLARDLGYWMSHVQSRAIHQANLVQSLFGKLAQQPIKNDVEAYRLLTKAYPNKRDVSDYYPSQLKDDKQKAIEEENSSRESIRDGIYGLFAGAGTAISPNYWGMLCATSEFFCHYQPSKRPTAESVMFGGRQKNIMAMVDVLASK